ncbi:hypothetical protein [Corynebacterium atrinae]
MSRLSSCYPELAEVIINANDGQKRRIALAVSELALSAFPNELEPSWNLLRCDRIAAEQLSITTSSALQLVERLDEEAWKIQEAADRGEASEIDYLHSFMKARAASSAVFASGQDPESSALDSVYEAIAALGSYDVVQKAVHGNLTA